MIARAPQRVSLLARQDTPTKSSWYDFRDRQVDEAPDPSSFDFVLRTHALLKTMNVAWMQVAHREGLSGHTVGKVDCPLGWLASTIRNGKLDAQVRLRTHPEEGLIGTILPPFSNGLLTIH